MGLGAWQGVSCLTVASGLPQPPGGVPHLAYLESCNPGKLTEPWGISWRRRMACPVSQHHFPEPY